MSQQNKTRRVAIALAAAVVGVSVAGVAMGLRLVAPAEPGGAAGDPQSGVYVKDSAIAADKFELGKRMERLKEWHKSADVYQEILEKYKDRVVPIQLDDKQRPIKYASVREAVRARLARWPEEGLTVYRNRFEPAAATMLESAKTDDLSRLHEAYDLYFVTDAGKQAGLRLIDLYLENGEFTHAAWISDRLLEWHPNLVVERPGVLFRAGVAYHLAGNIKEAERRLNELNQKFPEETATIGGKDRKLAEALAEQLKMPSAIAVGGTAESYPMFGGGPTRTVLSTAAARPYVRVAKLDTPGPIVAGSEAIKNAVNAQWENARNLMLTINIIPAVDKGEMFYQDGYRVWAVHVETGLPIPGWLQSYPQQSRLGQYVTGGGVVTNLGDQALSTQVMTPRQHTITLTEDAVLAVMGVPDMRNFGGQTGVDTGTKLVCLDRANGKPRWTVSAAAVPNNAGNVKNLNFSGSPLVVGENVYVIARGVTGAGVEDCHVFCYELDSGRFKWQCYIASAQLAGNPNMNPNGMPGGGVVPGAETLSHLAFASGRVFVVTNLGAVAAVDAYSGATAWLTIYPRDEETSLRRQRGAMGAFGMGWQAGSTGSGTKPWEFNPVMISEGKVFVLPVDGSYLTIYDAANGEEVRRIPRQFDHHQNTLRIDMLLAVNGEKLFVAADNTEAKISAVLCLDWTKAAREKGTRRLTEDSLLNMFPGEEIQGRPFVTSKHLYIPTRTKLQVIDIDVPDINKARVKQSYPKDGVQWPSPDEGPGNVVASGEHVIVANSRNISIYTDLDAVRARLAEQIKADPANVGPRLSFAEQVFNAREFEEAVRMLDEAIAVMGGLKDRQGPDRERVFRNAIIFAHRLGEVKTPDKKDYSPLVDALYETAAQAAVTASEQVTYRQTRAKSIENSRADKPDFARAVALYQEVLDSPDMRLVMMAGSDASNSMQAGKAAELAIKALIAKHGASVYLKFEDDAAGQLKELSAGGKPDALLALAERYPNASTASAALMKAAEFYEKADNPRMATQVLRRLYWKYGERYTGPQRAQLTEAMARNYLKSGNLTTALGRLQKAASVLPESALSGDLVQPDGKPLVDAEGKPVKTLKDAAEALEKLADIRSSAALADVRVPQPPVVTTEERMELLMKKLPMPTEIPFVKDAPDATVASVQRVLEAPEELEELVRHDRVVVAAGADILCLKPGETTPLWKSNALGEAGNGSAWLDRSRLLVWGDTSIGLLDGDGTGATKWKSELRGLAGVELVSGEGGPGDAAANAAMAGAAAAAAQQEEDPRIQALQVRRIAVARVVAAGNVVVQPGVAAGEAAEPQQNQNDGRERILHVRPLTDRLIATTTSGRVLAIDLKDGRVLWQTRLASSATILQTEATDDFAAVRLTEGGIAQLVVLDSFNGQLTFRRSFVMSSGNYVVNFALASDGTLVWTMPGSLVGKDLYEPNDAPWERPGRNFGGMIASRQLRIHNQTVLAVCDGGKTIDRRSLRSGNTVGNPMTTGSGGPNVALRMAGARLYVAGPNSLIVYHMEQDTSTKTVGKLQYDPADLMLTQDFTIVPGPIEERDDKASYNVELYSRNLIKSESTSRMSESGMRIYVVPVTTTSKVRSWHCVEGGIYYLTADDKLHFMKGAKK